jgi:hypothetical protein
MYVGRHRVCSIRCSKVPPTQLTERAHTLASAGVAFALAGKRDGPDGAPSPDTTLWPLNAAALTVVPDVGAAGERSCEIN